MDEFFDAAQAKWEKFKAYVYGIGTDWQAGRKPRAVGKVILPCLPVVLLVLVVLFVKMHWEAILILFGIITIMLYVLGEMKKKANERNRAEAERQEQLRQEAIRENARTADATYTKMANVIYDVARDLGPLGIVSPRMLSDIYSSGDRMISKQDGAVMLGLFTLQKSKDTVDTETMQFTMQEKINKKLTAGELPGVARDVIYNGRAYSGFIIHAVVNRPGFVEVYAVLTDENYCRFKMECEQNKSIPAPSVDRRDTDY